MYQNQFKSISIININIIKYYQLHNQLIQQFKPIIKSFQLFKITRGDQRNRNRERTENEKRKNGKNTGPKLEGNVEERRLQNTLKLQEKQRLAEEKKKAQQQQK